MLKNIHTPEFSDSIYTTKTILFEFHEQIDLNVIARTLPLQLITLDKEWKRTTKPKIKTFPPMGTIYSIRMMNFCRGVWGPFFKNSLMVDMSLATKSINIKISKHTIHICGIKEPQYGEYAAKLLAQCINDADKILQKIEQHHHAVLEFFQWIQSLEPGIAFTREIFTTERVKVKDKFKLRRVSTHTYETVNTYIPFTLEEASKLFSDRIPIDVIIWFHRRFSECKAIPDLNQEITWFSQNPNARCVTEGTHPLTVMPSERSVMMNGSFSIGFCILKQELRNYINSTQKDFIAHYNAGNDHYVNVELLCTPEEAFELTGTVSGDPIVGSTFIVYESGHVMISCKNKSHMKNSYDRFIRLIDELYPHIYDAFSTSKKQRSNNTSISVTGSPSIASAASTSSSTTPSPVLLPGTIIKRKQKVQVVPN